MEHKQMYLGGRLDACMHATGWRKPACMFVRSLLTPSTCLLVPACVLSCPRCRQLPAHAPAPARLSPPAGAFDAPEQAAHAHDIGALCSGKARTETLNFPMSDYEDLMPMLYTLPHVRRSSMPPRGGRAAAEWVPGEEAAVLQLLLCCHQPACLPATTLPA